jgi:hypothetical protein
MDEPRDVLLAEAILGKDAEEFLSSELGRFLLGCAREELQRAQDELATVSPWRRNRIKQLQNQVWRAKNVPQWLAEVITSGRSAQAMLEDRFDGE